MSQGYLASSTASLLKNGGGGGGEGGGEGLGITGSYFILRREPGDEAK